MKLGALAVKTAQAAKAIPNLQGAASAPQGLLGRMAAAAQRTHGLHGRRDSRYALGPTQSQQGGFVTGQQGVMEAILSTLGPFGLIAYQYLQPQINSFAQQTLGLDLSEPYQIGYGGSLPAAREQLRVTQELMSQQAANRGQIVKQFADIAAEKAFEFLNQVGLNVPEDFKENTKGWLKNLSPQQAGMFVQQLGMVIPEVNTVMSRVDPSFISDFSPLVHATRLRSGGRFNEEVFRDTLERFNMAYQSGQFPGVPAQVAMNAMDYAIEAMGDQANTAHAANIAKVANDLVQRGLAPSFGAAMALAGSIDQTGGALEPNKVRRYAAYLDQLATRGGIDKNHIYEAARYAQQKGTSIGAAMSAVGAGGRIRADIRGQAGEQLGDVAAATMAGLGSSDNMKLLAAVYETDPKGRRLIAEAIKEGDAKTLAGIAQRARFSSKFMSLRNSADSNELANMMAINNPRMLEAMAVFNAQQSARGNRELHQLLSNRKELVQRLRERDFTGLNPLTVRALKARGGSLPAAALLQDKELRRSLRRGERLRQPAMEDPEVPKRLGFGYPTDAPPDRETRQRFINRTATPPKRYKPPTGIQRVFRGVKRGLGELGTSLLNTGQKGIELLGGG